MIKTHPLLLAVALAQAAESIPLHSQTSPEQLLSHAESRFRAIYDRGTAVHLHMLMARYLVEHLPPGPR